MTPSPEPTSTTSHQRRKAERPQELLDAALSLFVEKGFAATRTDEVAARAGVSKGTLYLYYASKEELLKAVIAQRLSSQIAEGARQVAEHEGSCGDLLLEVLSRWWEGVIDSDASGVFKLIITEVRNFPDIAEFYAREVVEPGQNLIGGVVQRGIDRGEFRPMAQKYAVYSLIAPMIFLLMWQHSLAPCCPAQQQIEPQAFIDSQIDLLLGGMLAPPAVSRATKPRKPTPAKP